jgi:phospholipid/cholesterol/gamma-HCH transport system ATP-binding protein
VCPQGALWVIKTPVSLERTAVDWIIELREVDYAVAGHTVFKGLNLAVAPGQVSAIMGPSGTGKTTLLKLITGQIAPTRGEVWVNGQNLASLSSAQLYALRGRMGYLFQNGALLTDLSVFENVAFPLREHQQLPEATLVRQVLATLESVGLRGAAALKPAELSGGMARRVALARALVTQPEILLYDEPFAGLDPIALGVVLRLIRATNDALKLTSLVVSHDVHEIEKLADQIAIVADGRVIISGSPKALSESRDALVQQFLTGAPDGPVPFNYPAPAFDAHVAAWLGE